MFLNRLCFHWLRDWALCQCDEARAGFRQKCTVQYVRILVLGRVWRSLAVLHSTGLEVSHCSSNGVGVQYVYARRYNVIIADAVTGIVVTSMLIERPGRYSGEENEKEDHRTVTPAVWQ